MIEARSWAGGGASVCVCSVCGGISGWDRSVLGAVRRRRRLRPRIPRNGPRNVAAVVVTMCMCVAARTARSRCWGAVHEAYREYVLCGSTERTCRVYRAVGQWMDGEGDGYGMCGRMCGSRVSSRADKGVGQVDGAWGGGEKNADVQRRAAAVNGRMGPTSGHWM